MTAGSIRKFTHVKNVAETLCCSENQVYELIKKGELEAIRLGKCSIRISIDSIVEFLERKKIDPSEYQI